MTLFLLSFSAFVLHAGEKTPLPPASERSVDFQRDIQPLLTRNCLACHGPDEQQSSFRVDDRKVLLKGGDFGIAALKPGNSAESHLIQLVAGVDADLIMPPEGEGKRLTETDISLLRAWIDQGANMPEDVLATNHWSFQPINRPTPPQGDNASTKSPVDAFIVKQLRDKDLDLSPPAERRELIRRVYLDVTGLLPTPEKVEQFISNESPDAYEQLVEELLSSEHYGERWARHWLDVVRFAESNGFETNTERPNAYHYRDWVIRSLNDDMPYDRFVTAQLAGDSIGEDAATGFLVGGAYDSVKSPDPGLTAMQRQDELADIVNTTSTAFLGLTIGCARCHTHKFDPILQKDYYSLQAVFAGVRHGERAIKLQDDPTTPAKLARINSQIAKIHNELAAYDMLPPVNARQNEERFPAIEARFVRFVVEASNSSEPCLDELEIWTADEQSTNVALATNGGTATSSGNYQGNPKHRLAHVNDGKVGNDYSWISNQSGKGWVQIQLAMAQKVDRIVWGRDRTERYTDRLATAYRIEVATTPGNWKVVASSKGRLAVGGSTDAAAFVAAGLSAEDAAEAADLSAQLASLQRERSRLLGTSMAYAGTFVQPPPTHRLYRGDPMAPREVVTPEALTSLHPMVGELQLETNTAEQQRRIALARWITSPNNPLTARVMVNRLWHYHFGRGLVATPSDFGEMGFKPTHPELLDWLAAEFVSPSDGSPSWSLKHIHRLILLSRTYQQSSAPREAALKIDRNATLLWRFPPRRLEAEAIRDTILQVSGSLDTTMYGPGFMVFQPNGNYSRNWIAKDDFGPAEFRRMVYALDLRMEHDAVFGAFDCPDGGQVTPKRARSTTPIQSLNLFNSRFVHDQAVRFANRATAEAGDDVAAQVRKVFALALLREPTDTELRDATELVNAHGLPALCRAMFNTNEFLFLR